VAVRVTCASANIAVSKTLAKKLHPVVLLVLLSYLPETLRGISKNIQFN
jgi:hypothetical protein